MNSRSTSLNPRGLFFCACAGLSIFGITLAVLGTLFGLPETHERLHLGMSQQGHIFLLLYLGVFLSNLLVGPIIDALGHKPVMLTSAALVAVSLAAFAGVHSFAGAGVVVVVLGFGGGGLNTASNCLVSDLYTEERGPMLNLLGTFFGVGALGVPLLAAGMQGHVPVAGLLWSAAAVSGLSAVMYAVLRFPLPHKAGGVSLMDTVRVASYPGLLWIGVLLLVEAGNEAAIGGWTSIYAGSVGLPPRAATLVLACYWAAMIAGRVLASRFVQRLGKPRTILVSALGAILGCGLLLSVNSVAMLAVGATLIGLSFAPIFQTALGIAGDRYQHSSGSVFGFLFAMALSGAMAWPWAVGQISEHSAVRCGMVIPLGGALCICAMAAAMRRKSVRQERSERAAVS